jgi:predicted DNA-binding transcriptional regulator YafY
MSRATRPQQIERLNLAWQLLQRLESPLAAVDELVRTCGLSKRQAYRYVEDAQQLRRPLPAADAKVAFTVKLSRALVARLRAYAASTGDTLSDIVSRAVVAVLRRRGGRA